jgi:hypothetical protein
MSGASATWQFREEAALSATLLVAPTNTDHRIWASVFGCLIKTHWGNAPLRLGFASSKRDGPFNLANKIRLARRLPRHGHRQ